MRTGTVASVDNRNWELGDHVATVRRLSQSRAIALDMELATIAANGFRFRVPYGTLLCVSDKPLARRDQACRHGRRSSIASEVDQHLEIGLNALEKLKAQERERLHSRKLRSFCRSRVSVNGASSLRDSEPNLVRWTNMACASAGVLALSQPRLSPKLRRTAAARPRSADPLTAAQRLGDSNFAVRQERTFAHAGRLDLKVRLGYKPGPAGIDFLE